MERICQPKTGLFPAPQDIRINCSCPDWTTMCKHVAAALYGVGARLDAQPELLFTLRQVDANDLVTQAAEASVKTRKTPARGKVLDDAQLADVFGIEMDTPKALPGIKKKTGTRRAKPMEPPAVAMNTQVRTSTDKKAVATKKKTATTTEPQPRKKKTQATVKPATARKSDSSATGKRTSRQIVPSTPAQTKRNKART